MARLPGLQPGRYAGGLRGFSTGLPALTKNWPASMPATLRAIPPPARRAIGARRSRAKSGARRAPEAKCRAEAKAKAKGHRGIPARGTWTRLRPVRCAAKLHEPEAFDLRGPCAAVRVGRTGPQGDRHGCRSLFVRAGSPVEKPGQPSRTCRAISPASAKRGALSFGYFSLSTQRKVTRRSADRRKPAAGEPGRGSATSAPKKIETLPRAPAPHPSPLPGGERELKAGAAIHEDER